MSTDPRTLLVLTVCCLYRVQREITRKLTFPKQPTNPFLEMVKFLLERIAPVHIDSEAIRSETNQQMNKHVSKVGLF